MVVSAIRRHDGCVCLLRTRPSYVLLVGTTVVSLTTSSMKIHGRYASKVIKSFIFYENLCGVNSGLHSQFTEWPAGSEDTVLSCLGWLGLVELGFSIRVSVTV